MERPAGTETSRPSLTARVRQVLVAWTEPHPTITEATARRKARLASSLLLVLIPLALVFVLVYGSPRVGTDPANDAIQVVSLFLIVGTYAVSRSRRVRLAAALTVAIPWLAIAASFVVQPSVNHDLLYYGLIPVLAAGLLLEAGSAAGLAAFNILGVFLVHLGPAGAADPLLGTDLATHVLFLATGSALVIVGSAFLERSARDAEEYNRRLREADRFRLQLLNTVAHDLASPLQPIVLQLDLARRGGDVARALDIVDRNTRHLQRLVADVRDLSKIESGALSMDLGPVALDRIVRDAVDSYQAVAQDRGIRLEGQAAGPVTVEGDADRLNQVVLNLLNNALKFTPSQGSVVLTAHAEDGFAQVVVRDSGRGLVPDEIARLFRPFSQVHERHEVKEKGTGLGLFISRGIVEAHGGRIWVESEGHGKGSAFCFRVPVRAGPGPAAS